MTQEIDVLLHTASTGRYVTGDPFVIDIARRGLLIDHGPQSLAGGMHYLTLSGEGREAVRAWNACQPKPKRKRVRPEFAAWRRYCEAFADVPFGEFFKRIWPQYKERGWA